MRERGEDFGESHEDAEIQNLPLYTERKADGIYRYRRRVPKRLISGVGKGYLYRNLGRTKQDVVRNWPDAHAEIEAILEKAPSERSVPLSEEAIQAIHLLTKGKAPEEPVFERYARPRGMDSVSAMVMSRFRKVITDKKLTMHSLRHRMKDKLRNTGCPEAISMAILGHSANTVAANYGSGYALEVMREHMEKVWI